MHFLVLTFRHEVGAFRGAATFLFRLLNADPCQLLLVELTGVDAIDGAPVAGVMIGVEVADAGVAWGHEVKVLTKL